MTSGRGCFAARRRIRNASVGRCGRCDGRVLALFSQEAHPKWCRRGARWAGFRSHFCASSDSFPLRPVRASYPRKAGLPQHPQTAPAVKKIVGRARRQITGSAGAALGKAIMGRQGQWRQQRDPQGRAADNCKAQTKKLENAQAGRQLGGRKEARTSKRHNWPTTRPRLRHFVLPPPPKPRWPSHLVHGGSRLRNNTKYRVSIGCLFPKIVSENLSRPAVTPCPRGSPAKPPTLRSGKLSLGFVPESLRLETSPTLAYGRNTSDIVC